MIWKVLNVFFVTVGVISTILIVSGLFMYWMWMGSVDGKFGDRMMEVGNVDNTTTQAENFDHPLLSPAQERAAASVGIDVSAIPTAITREQTKCSIEALGEERVKAIEAGDAPTAFEILKARHCFE